MADTKISALTDGAPAVSTDILPIARSGTNRRVTVGDISALSAPVAHVGAGGTAHADVIAGGASGFMTGTDKTKLDGIATGATANTGDVVGQASSVDSEIALFSGTGGKTIKRATTTGVIRADNGVISVAIANTDYATPTVAKFLAEGTWANIPSAASNSGRIYPCTDVGDCGLTFWVSNGSAWRLMGPTNLFYTVTPATGAANTNEQALNPIGTFPAGVLRSLRYWTVKMACAKSGTADGMTIRLRAGTVNTTAATQIISLTGAMVAANRQTFLQCSMFSTSDTNIRLIADRFNDFGVTSTAVAHPIDTTVSDMAANAFYMVPTMQNANTGADAPQVSHVHIIGY